MARLFFVGHRRPQRSFPGQRRQGAIAVLVALLLVAFLVTVAFSVDLAYMQLTRSKLRVATDAAARAAGEALSRQQDLDASRQAAKDIAQANAVAGDPLLLADSDIVFGNSSRESQGPWNFSAGSTPINSVQVLGRRTNDSLSGSVPTFFGRVLGVNEFQPQQVATVVRLDRDICLVVDRSTSMKRYLDGSGASRLCDPPDMTRSRWSALAEAVQVFVETLDGTPQTEYLALVSYASNYSNCGVRNLRASVDQELDGDTSLTVSALGRISARAFNGNTNIEEGVKYGLTVLTDTSRARPYAAKTLIVMTDGNVTEGGAPVSQAKMANENDIIIHSVTFGDDVGEKDMRDLAEATGGNYYHASDASELREAFRKIALTLPVIFTD